MTSKSLTLKIDPGKLPKPPLEPTKTYHVNKDNPPSLKTPERWKERIERAQKNKRRQSAWNAERKACLVQMIAEGMSRKDIADELGTTVGSVNKQIQRLRRKGVDI